MALQSDHFPSLEKSTVTIWERRYKLLKDLEHLPMDQILPSTITTWVNDKVSYFKSNDRHISRGHGGRCNLNNELNLLITIFNWYKQSERDEKEALFLTCPVKRKHKSQGFIKPLPDRRKQIGLEDTLLFFAQLKPLYQDLAMLQFYCAGRIGEIAGLQWSCIDIERKRMLIKHTCVWDNTTKVFDHLKNFPKNKEPRPVFISEEIKNM